MNCYLNLNTILACFVFLFINSCKPTDHTITIRGHITKLHRDKIYLYSIHDFDHPLDSALVKDDRFEFVIHPDKNFVPFIAAIIGKGFTYADVIPNFFTEPGVTLLEGELRGHITVNSGPENALMTKYLTLGFQDEQDTAKRSRYFNYINNRVKENPHSYYILDRISACIYAFRNEELRILLGNFSSEVAHSAGAKKIRQMLALRPDHYDKVTNFNLLTPYYGLQPVILPGKKYNLIIFWASWCHACREDIPQFKSIYNETGDHQNLNMVSVSIDKKDADWGKALLMEKMPWRQLRVDSMQMDAVEGYYNLGAIPTVVLADDKGNVLRRFKGFGDENRNDVIALLTAID